MIAIPLLLALAGLVGFIALILWADKHDREVDAQFHDRLWPASEEQRP